MSKPWTPRKPTVELRPSRIRREPPRVEKKAEAKKARPVSREQEIMLGIAGVVLFAIIIAIVTIGFSAITGHDDPTAATDQSQQFVRCGVGDGSNCVIDGDTVRIADETVEIAGMDAPKLRSAACAAEAERGAEAVERLIELLNGGKVEIAGNLRGPDGQLKTRVTVDGRDVGAAMVASGAARDPASGPASWC